MNLQTSPDNFPDKFSGRINHYDCNFCLSPQKLQIELVSKSSFSQYTVDIDEPFLKECKNLDFFFLSVAELYHYLVSCFNSLTIGKDGALMFNLQVNLGSLQKKYECKIETNKHEMDEDQLFTIKMNRLQAQVSELTLQNQIIEKRMKVQVDCQRTMEENIDDYAKVLITKDEVINSIFLELKELKKWKEEYQSQLEEQELENTRFILDLGSPLSQLFRQEGRRIIKKEGGSWDIIMNTIPISKSKITKHNIRQVKAGTNGSLMYGIATEHVKDMKRAQDSKHFIGYYQLTGNIYEQSTSKKGGAKIKDGQLVTVVVDPLKWKIYWYIEGKRQAEASIGAEIRTNDLYLSCVMFNSESEVEFI